MEFLDNLLFLYLEAAPWLVLGLLAAGLLRAWVPEARLNRWLGGRGIWPLVKAALVGAPLPLCSCGVVPAALGLRRAGASRGVTLSFMVATPETGPDSISISYALLGPFMAVIRPVAAVASAIFTGLLAMRLPEPPPDPLALGVAACDGGSCCATETVVPAGIGRRTLSGVAYAFTSILGDIALWTFAGLLLAAVMLTWIPPLAIAQWGEGLLAMFLMMVVGVPMYICATASTPIAVGLLAAGVSPGAVLVFLLAGPATNLATMAIIRREMGNATLLAYLAGIVLSSLAFGLGTDALVAAWGLDVVGQMAEAADLVPRWLAVASGVLLVVAWAVGRRPVSAGD